MRRRRASPCPRPTRTSARSLAALAVDAPATPPDAALRLYWTGTTLVATTAAIPPELEERRRRGIRLAALELGVDVSPPGWLLAGVKSTSYAVNMAAEAEARRRGADDAVFLAAGGIVLEAPISNIWWRRGGMLRTPAVDVGVLAGVTRATLLELAPAAGYAVEEGAFAIDDLRAADEAFTSSSIREIVPAVALDGAAIGAGTPGEAAAVLQRALRELAGS